MVLLSRLFRGVPELEACQAQNAAHITPGATGHHIRLIQTALCRLGFTNIVGVDYVRGYYGPSTAAAVLRYKSSRKIINSSYQTAPDNIVGKMTITRLDGEMNILEHIPELHF